MKNRKLIIHGMYLSDIVAVLKSHDIACTKENIVAYAREIQNIASAYAKAALQDATREECLDAIDIFKQFGYDLTGNPMVQSGTVLNSGQSIPSEIVEDERMRLD